MTHRRSSVSASGVEVSANGCASRERETQDPSMRSGREIIWSVLLAVAHPLWVTPVTSQQVT